MLLGDKILLREWRESDLSVLASLRNNVELQTLLMSQPRPNSEDRVRTWLNEISARENTVFFVIARHIDDAVEGYLQVTNIDKFSGHGELGICVSPDAQGKGIASEACDVLEQYLSRILMIRKIVLKVLVENYRAVSFYRKRGYRDVGVLKAHHLTAKIYHDVLMMEFELKP